MTTTTNGGGGPPKDISPGMLWAKLQEMPRPSRTVEFPRLGPDNEPIGEVAIWVLTQEEQMMCSAAAEKFAKERVKDGKREDLGYETIYANESVVQILLRACRDPLDVSRSIFPTASAIRSSLTSEECGRLFEYYLSVQLDLGPIITKLTEEELDLWVDRLVEGGLAASPFVLLSPDMQKVLAHSMASQIARSRKDTSSAGSPLDAPPLDAPTDAPPSDLDPDPDADPDASTE
jgi:hypothetical protein